MKCLQSPGVFHHHNEPLPTPAPAVFLDRDGVLVEETGYLHTIENAILIPGAAHAVRRLNLHHIPAIIVTNQAGIARGYYAWKDFHTVQTHIEQEFQRHGARFDGLWACAHHPNGAGPLASDHPFRKPNPGMILDAGTKLNLDLSRSWLIGDKTIDIQAARNASSPEPSSSGPAMESPWKTRSALSLLPLPLPFTFAKHSPTPSPSSSITLAIMNNSLRRSLATEHPASSKRRDEITT